MDLQTRLKSLAVERNLGGNFQATLAIAALALLDKNNDVILDADNPGKTLLNLVNGASTAQRQTLVDALATTTLLEFKGNIAANTNPNYPAASKGDSYVTSVAGKVGGASGKNVDVGDFIIATADNAGGSEASVGTSWIVLEHNLPTLGTAATKDVGTGSNNVAAGDAPAAAQAAAIAAAPNTVFPDTDPHIAGAGYWVAGVLTKSTG